MEDFVTFEIAKKLKEKGYPQHIAEDVYIIDNYGEDEYKIGDRLPIPLIPDYIDDIAAPIVSQVFKWLRNNKKTMISILPVAFNEKENKFNKYYCTIYYATKEFIFESHERPGTFNTYEECALDAIEYVLDNLI